MNVEGEEKIVVAVMHAPAPDSIYALIASHARERPEAVALGAPGRTPLTYRALHNLARDVVTRINALGIGRGDRIALVLPNGPEMASTFLTVAGVATCAPLNPAYKARDFDFYLTDLNAKALIVLRGDDSPARGVATRRGIPILEVERLEDEPAGAFRLIGATTGTPVQGGPCQPDDTALVLHTSGTTSRPKMVPLTQRNLCASARNISATLQLSPADRCLNVMPLFHIHGLMGAVLSSITAGAGIVCTPGFAPARFFEWLDAVQPTWYTAVPTMHQAVLSQAAHHETTVARSRLRLIRSSSASLPPNVMRALETRFRAPVIESYGMTEAAHQMASNPLPPGLRKPGSVGLAAGPDVAVMDEAGVLLPARTTGEIVIRGANVTAGYENNPEANADAFTRGWFRTGDEGYLDEDRYLYITGRLKEMINRGGEKITPREIDEVFLGHPAVAQATTFAVPHATLGEDVATAVVLRNGEGPQQTATEAAFRDYAFAHLADFKVPSRVMIVDAIPKGPTGKLQRIGLHEILGPQLTVAYAPPTNEFETYVCAIWREVLGTKRVGRDDNFFFCGGDSLRAAQVVARVQARFDIALPLTAIFRHPTVAGLSARIEEERLDRAAPSQPPPLVQLDRRERTRQRADLGERPQP